MLRGVGIEANPAVENYSLYRAVTAQKTLLDSAKIGDRQTFLETFEQYRNAMYGTPVPRFQLNLMRTDTSESRMKKGKWDLSQNCDKLDLTHTNMTPTTPSTSYVNRMV